MNDDEQRAAASRVFARMRRLVLESSDRRREVIDATGMSFARSRVLRRLARGPMRMSELAAEMVTDKPYMTLLVDDLEQRGLVTRAVDPDDRRAKLVSPTEAGHEIARRAEAILAEPPATLSRLTPDELAALETLLAKIDD
ncbi:MarR family winged helix-turn-helix transcriptional regulator [Yinghuangia seranimata]|uniref:MarR family winged helix-turn-helix transcriptional regulator n=1 Tax=Yinghuangia seranimata TaxID=408067 RepID=UPI00248C4BB1|nr:MarR family transcriptional regulator [Yinghuangia seranimata]MDI2124917.1 MarR family transcriptional regulator [Yinghuangia seranimata]